MRYLVDTGLLIRHLRGQKKTVQLLRRFSKANRLCISTVTRLEVRAGAHPDEVSRTEKLLSRFVNLELTAPVADRAAEIIVKGKQSNRAVAVPDAIIAATALVHNLTLLTYNASDFRRVAGLSLHPRSS